MVPVRVFGTITDSGSGVDPTKVTFSVADEYGIVQPSGPVSLSPDGTYSFTILLQAYRHGGDKNGRQYTITVSARDLAGNLGSASTTVVVPHDDHDIHNRDERDNERNTDKDKEGDNERDRAH